jgi:hypothetical protein
LARRHQNRPAVRAFASWTTDKNNQIRDARCAPSSVPCGKLPLDLRAPLGSRAGALQSSASPAAPHAPRAAKPRASPHSRGSACGLDGARRLKSTSKPSRPVPHWPYRCDRQLRRSPARRNHRRSRAGGATKGRALQEQIVFVQPRRLHLAVGCPGIDAEGQSEFAAGSSPSSSASRFHSRRVHNYRL